MTNQWDDVYQDELESINELLADPKKVNRNQDTIYPRGAISQIGIQFQRLGKKYRFATFRFIHPDQFKDDYQTVRSVRRLVKLRFRCKNQRCPQFKNRQSQNQKSSEIERHWTSYNGVVEFKFYITLHQQSSQTLCRVSYTFNLFMQKCLKCIKWGRSGLIASCFDNLINLYSLLIQNSLIKIRDNKEIEWYAAQKYGRKLMPLNGSPCRHISELCEACLKGICPRFYLEKKEDQANIKRKQQDQPKVKKQYRQKKIYLMEEESFEFITGPTKSKIK